MLRIQSELNSSDPTTSGKNIIYCYPTLVFSNHSSRNKIIIPFLITSFSGTEI